MVGDDDAKAEANPLATCPSALPGAEIISDPIAATFDDRVFPGGLTYSGHPLAAASIVARIDAMKDEDLRRSARDAVAKIEACR
mgnify:CR=1 FL=1